MNFSQAMEYIKSFSRPGRPVTDLSRIKRLMDRLGNPQDDLLFVHVAGTNGKGSVVEFCSGALIESGHRTGQFTSPFIDCYNDRIRINGENISEEKVAELCERVREAASGNEYSQFEITLAIAILYYMEESCDIVCLETGVGGRLDATNIIKNPVVSILTSISFDHVQVLGNTLSAIAAQKAGIIKPGCPAVLSIGNEPEVVNTVKRAALSVGSSLTIPEAPQIISESVYGSEFEYGGCIYKINMPGEHQILNAVTAIEAVNAMRRRGFNVPDSALRKSFEKARIGARTEVIKGKPDIIIDGGHNVGGINALVKTLELLKRNRLIAVCGMVNTKDYLHSASLLSEIFDEVICVDGFAENCVKAEELAKGFNCKVLTMNYRDGFEYGRKKALLNGGTLVVCGSLYLASAVRKLSAIC